MRISEWSSDVCSSDLVVDVDQLVDPRHDENHGDEQAPDKNGDHGHGVSSSGVPRPLVQTGRAGGGSGSGLPISARRKIWNCADQSFGSVTPFCPIYLPARSA